MVTAAEAAVWILDCDGSCRDVTFTPTTKSAVLAFLKFMLAEYSITSAFDNHGIDRSHQLRSDDPLAHIAGYLHIVLTDGRGLIHVIQLFIDKDHAINNHYCVEVTFFPNDIDMEQFSLNAFQSLIDSWSDKLKSDDYFVRCENASWDLYDPAGLGVIYSRNQPPVT